MQTELKAAIVELQGEQGQPAIIIIAIVVLLICYLTWYMFRGRNVSDNGTGIDAVTNQLSTVGSEQQSALDGITTVESGLSGSQKSVDGISSEVGEVSTGLDSTQKQLQTLQTEPTQAKASLLTAQASLQTANESLQTYVKEVKTETNSLKIQRDIGWIAFVVAVFRK
jgi:hypothetical protein